MTTKKLLTLLITAAICTVTGNSFAASDGSLAATSSGSADITMTVDEVALITGMEDFTALDLHYVSGTGDVTAFKNVCVYTNDAGGTTVGNASDSTGKYKVTAQGNSGDGTGNLFSVVHDASATDKITYTLSWADAVGGGGTGLVTTVKSAVFNNARTIYTQGGAGGGCGADNASYTILFTADNILDHPAGDYTGTLTIVVSPDDT